MINDIQKSINSSLYERLTSPLWGAIVAGWLVFNWEVIYITFFGKEEYLGCGKLDYILIYLYSPENFYLYPIAVVAFLLLVFPFISNGAYYLHLKFKSWKENKRNEIENKTLLSVEQSLKLRESLRNQVEAFNNLTKDKELEIKSLKDQLNQLAKQSEFEIQKHINSIKELELSNKSGNSTLIENNTITKTDRDYWEEDFQFIENNISVLNTITTEINKVSSGYHKKWVNEMDDFSIFVNLELVELKNDDNYYLTKKGKYFALKFI